MSKLYDALQDQLKTEHKKEAEDCIKIYNVLKAISREKYGEEHVWSSDWNVLTTTMLVGSYPNVRKMYKPSPIGKVFLIGILLYAKTGECDCIYIYDESSYCGWYLRYCGICGSLVSLV